MSADTNGFWGVAIVVGPILLAIALLWAIFRNRANRGDIDRTEQATRENYAEQDRADKRANHEEP